MFGARKLTRSKLLWATLMIVLVIVLHRFLVDYNVRDAKGRALAKLHKAPKRLAASQHRATAINHTMNSTTKRHQMKASVAETAAATKPPTAESVRDIHRRISEATLPSLGGKRRIKHRPRTPNGDFSLHEQSTYVDQYLRERRGGYFVDVGARDGETHSSSLFFELERNWTGLLVEANPDLYPVLITRRRNAWTLNACVGGRAGHTFLQVRSLSHMLADSDKNTKPSSRKAGSVNVTCYAFNDIIRALKIRHVDYWSLNGEGAELAILENVDWSKLPPIDVIGVECKVTDAHGETDHAATILRVEQVQKIMTQSGVYKELKTLKGVYPIFGRIHAANKSPQFGGTGSGKRLET